MTGTEPTSEGGRRPPDTPARAPQRTGARESDPADTVSAYTATRQQIMYCPYCAEETLFPLERGWECRSCGRAFSITFLGLRSRASGTEGAS